MLLNPNFKYNNNNNNANYPLTPISPNSPLSSAGMMEMLISNYDAMNSGFDLQCELLQECIEDVERNAKKYHISYMIEKINYGTLEDIKDLKGINELLAHRLITERRRGSFPNASALSRVGLSRDMVETLIQNNC
jgi:hypothetical protein